MALGLITKVPMMSTVLTRHSLESREPDLPQTSRKCHVSNLWREKPLLLFALPPSFVQTAFFGYNLLSSNYTNSSRLKISKKLLQFLITYRNLYKFFNSFICSRIWVETERKVISHVTHDIHVMSAGADICFYLNFDQTLQVGYASWRGWLTRLRTTCMMDDLGNK